MVLKDILKKFAQRAIELGASDCKPIRTKIVVTGHWVRLKCQFGCDGYGKCLTCPPHSPRPEETQMVLNEYVWALLLKFTPSPPDFDYKAQHSVSTKLEREVFLAGYHKALAFANGPCPYCKTCNFEECAHPELARPSMEAAGIDVFTTVRNAGYEIKVIQNEKEQPTYFSLVLVE